MWIGRNETIVTRCASSAETANELPFGVHDRRPLDLRGREKNEGKRGVSI